MKVDIREIIRNQSRLYLIEILVSQKMMGSLYRPLPYSDKRLIIILIAMYYFHIV